MPGWLRPPCLEGEERDDGALFLIGRSIQRQAVEIETRPPLEALGMLTRAGAVPAPPGRARDRMIDVGLHGTRTQGVEPLHEVLRAGPIPGSAYHEDRLGRELLASTGSEGLPDG